MIKQYQINIAAKTSGGLDLDAGFQLIIIAVSIEDKLRLVVQTCIENGSPPELNAVDQYENIEVGGVCVYDYAVPADSAKSVNTIIKNTFESDLDNWFGAGNWQAV